MVLKDKSISINTIEDLLRCINLASLLELSGYPKPGNIHRTQDFKDTRFEHFLAGIAAIQPNFRNLCLRSYKIAEAKPIKFENVKLGVFFTGASEAMIRWQEGGNVLLGHILILAPLASAAAICLKTKKLSLSDYSTTIKKIIANATVEDTKKLFQAIRKCKPGGLGKVDKYDLSDETSIEQILRDGITLKQIFEISKTIDLISLEYSTGFNIVLKEGLPFYIEVYNNTNDINIATVNTFLKILSQHYDTLIIRKTGLKNAKIISQKAFELLEMGGIASKDGLKLSKEFDILLQKERGKLNPGTTADILAGIIFCALLIGLKY